MRVSMIGRCVQVRFGRGWRSGVSRGNACDEAERYPGDQERCRQNQPPGIHT
jgi:hypothetical protein